MININIKKQYQQATGLIQRLINNTHLFVNWCYCGREVLFEKVCLLVIQNFVLYGKQFHAEQKRGIH